MFSTLFKKKKNKIFIHIPKVGGSTFVGLLKDSHSLEEKDKNTPTHIIESVGNVEIKHIDFKSPDRRFKSPDIFNPSLNKKYKTNSSLFMLVRHPFERLLSEFNFQFHILDGKSGNKSAQIINRLPCIPKNFEEYFSQPETQNYQCKFLLGRSLADPKEVTVQDFENITSAIDSLPIYCGTTEEYSAFINLFSSISEISLNDSMVVRKKTPSSFKKSIPVDQKNRLLDCNAFDVMLYKYISNLSYGNIAQQEYKFVDSSSKFIP